ncbi:hypothetical protein ANN_19190 [Periplaneta americana]|uniref:Reverse transcriptase domain-containing protein n=1 Tax=Periplaneta americana TaxID=6978 RepID=A0ABQ8S959_PERAM|nr:hypothetical protein ANN_19190 [Periplaneta americana]
MGRRHNNSFKKKSSLILIIMNDVFGLGFLTNISTASKTKSKLIQAEVVTKPSSTDTSAANNTNEYHSGSQCNSLVFEVKLDIPTISPDDTTFLCSSSALNQLHALNNDTPSQMALWFESNGEDPQTIKENTEILHEASKAIGLKLNPEKTKYFIVTRDQNIVRNGNRKIGDLSFEEVEKFKYLEVTVTNINDTREEIKRRINMGNACYYSVEKLLSSSLLSKNLKVRIYKTVILPVVLCGFETWTLTLREEQRLKVFGNKVLRKIFGTKRDEVTGEWRKLHNAELHEFYSSSDIIRNIKSRRWRWA